MAGYRFLTTWILAAAREPVWDAIYEIERWPSWWRGVRQVQKLEDGDGDGVGSLYRHEWRSVIPYPVRFETRITKIELPHLIEAEADGELAGMGRWRFFGDRETAVTYEWDVRTTRAWMNLGACCAPDLPLEPQRRDAPGRRGPGQIAGRAPAGRHVACLKSAMRVLVTGGAGFIGSHFAKRLKAAGEDVRVLDKLTYSGNPANLDGTEIELLVGDICDAEAVADAAAGCDAIVNFAAETHVDRSILGPAEFIQTDVAGTQVLLDHAGDAGIRLRARLDRRGLR